MAPTSGPYQLRQPNDDLLSLLENLVGSPVAMLGPAGNPGEQEWHLQNEGDSVTLKNLKHNLYAGVQDNPQIGAPVVGVPQPFKWKLEEAGPFRFFLYTDSPNGQLYLDYSPTPIYPPKAALSSKREKPWILQFLE
ncbi:unnamed protein product [Rhizoctonia solani]|uniref:Ricin B lectin domain-containing protein n=1 Tax=Rhizoctonia solani TaxID=456999 RepID=A0A8H3C2Y7_9AGAM|nr:unnamed protein product [Rhizoctonia solani]